MTDARAFLADLRREVETHAAVNHPFLVHLSERPLTRAHYLAMGLQHYALVGTFTTYLEQLLVRGPDSPSKQWIAKVLVDEYGEGSDGKDHPELYRDYLAACGATAADVEETPLHPAVTGFVDEHLRIVALEPFLVGLGAVGPGHEWSIPLMFPRIVAGLRGAGVTDGETLYFDLHCAQDVDHGRWLEQALERFCHQPEAQQQVRRGALLSLEARARFWSGVEECVLASSGGRRTTLDEGQPPRLTLREHRSRRTHHTLAT